MPPPKRPKPAIQKPLSAVVRAPRQVARPTPKPQPKPSAAAQPPATRGIARVPDLAARAEALIARAFEIDRRTSDDFYEYGEVLRDLSDPAYVRALSFRTFDQLLKARELPKRAKAYRLIKITRHLDRDTAYALGYERAYRSIVYAEKFAPRTPPKTFLRLDRKLTIAEQTYPLRTIPTELLIAAVDALKAGTPLAPPPVTLERTSRGLAQILDHRGIEATAVRSRHKAGKSEIVISLPLSEAKKLLAFLK